MNIAKTRLPDIHDSVLYFCKRLNRNEVLFISTQPTLTDRNTVGEMRIIMVKELLSLKERLRKRANGEKTISIKELDSLAKDGIVIVENPRELREKYAIDIDALESIASILIRVGEDNETAINKYDRHGLLGSTRQTLEDKDKEVPIALGGSLASINLNVPQIKVLAIITSFNEKDMISWVINHLLSHGLDVHVIDNWSNDGTYEIIRTLSQSNKKLSVERFPLVNSGKYEWEKLLTRVGDFARSSSYDWIMHNDADEIRLSPWHNVSLSQAFSYVNSTGCNSVDFTVFDFRPIKDGFNGSKNPQHFFKYGEFGARAGHFLQIKAWKNSDSIDLAGSGGHHAIVPNQKVFPLKFFLGHYSLRSTRQAKDKIFKNRKPRFTKEEKSKGWHIQYDKFDEKADFMWDKSMLIRYDDSFADKYILERTTGCGIKRIT